MKKSLLLLPLLALPTFTLAEVQLYGTVKSGIETSRTRYSQTAVRDYDSHLGMRGSIPLGGSTAAVYQFDTSGSDSGSLRDRLRRKKESGAMPMVGGR